MSFAGCAQHEEMEELFPERFSFFHNTDDEGAA